MNICIIPARGGSKRIKRKNIKNFCDKPIISYPINAAFKSKIFDKVIVSTDDIEISKYALEYGADVPFLRPYELSDDYTSTIEVIKHTINFLQKNNKLNLVCCLYPTAAFVKSSDLIEAANIFRKHSDSVLIAAKKYTHPIKRAFYIKENGKTQTIFNDDLNSRTQDLDDCFHDAGQFYMANSYKWLKIENLIKNSVPFVIPYWRIYDIDTIEDWKKAELIFEILRRDNFFDK